MLDKSQFVVARWKQVVGAKHKVRRVVGAQVVGAQVVGAQVGYGISESQGNSTGNRYPSIPGIPGISDL